MIYVVAHKMFTPPDLDESYRTIFVGDRVRAEAKKDGFLVDSDGDSISDKNPYYCELTALYWIWKNDKSNDWIGLNHYRRYFISSDTGKILTKDEIENLLQSHDVILWDKIIWNESVERSYYRGAGYKKDLLILKKYMRKFYPDYMDALEEILKGKSASYANMFIMNRQLCNDYCEWLFRILSAMECEVDMTGYTVQEKRIYGYLGEILLNVWIKKHGLNTAYCTAINTEVGTLSWKDIARMNIKNAVKRIIYFPSGIKYKRLYKR